MTPKLAVPNLRINTLALAGVVGLAVGIWLNIGGIWLLVAWLGLQAVRLVVDTEFRAGALAMGGLTIIRLSLVALIALGTRPYGQLIWLLALVALELIEPQFKDESRAQWLAVAVQFFGTTAVFLAAAVWRLPTVVILLLIALVSFGAAKSLAGSEREGRVVPLAWTIVASECAWVLDVWLVNYVVAGGVLVIPMAALILSGLGYSVGGVFLAHQQHRLSRAKLAEYLIVAAGLVAVIIFGTTWAVAT